MPSPYVGGVEPATNMPLARANGLRCDPRRPGCVRSRGGREVVPGGVAAHVEDVADDGGRNNRADAVNLRQPAATCPDLDRVADQLDRAFTKLTARRPSQPNQGVLPFENSPNKPLVRANDSEPPIGIEPMTYALRVRRSAI
jgi:hypothetical protein